MDKNFICLGIDVGNSDTKSQNTSFPSGYEGPFTSKPLINNEYLELDGKYYSLSPDSFYYMRDKTKDDRCIILTLISISKEIIHRIEKSGKRYSEYQNEINKFRHIALGVGLPMSHYKKEYIDNLIEYYERYMKNGLDYEYSGFKFHIEMDKCGVYPQGGAAAACKSNKIAEKYNTYYVIDIGGYTIDVAMFKNGTPAKDRLSLEMGIITLHDSIKEIVFRNFDINIDNDAIETILRHENTILKQDVIELVLSMAEKHANNILNALRQQKILFDSHPCLFVGGGSILLKDTIMNNPMINKDAVQFLDDVHANAKAYARLIRSEI